MVMTDNDDRSPNTGAMARIYSIGSRAFVTFGQTPALRTPIRPVQNLIASRPLFQSQPTSEEPGNHLF